MNEQIKQRIAQLNNGEVPIGYEKTDFGIFPCDWVTDKKLKDLGSFGKGKGLPGDKMTTDGVPCVGYGDIYMKYNHFHFEEAQTFVDEETASESQPIHKGTLLFTGTGETADEIGKCVCYNGDETIYAGGDIITFVSKEVNPLFLAYQQYQEFSLRKKASYGQGHSVVHIQRENLEKLNVAYPKSEEEQSKIAEILMKWDEAVRLKEQYIEKLKERKKSILDSLLTPQNHWKPVKVKDIFKITRGQVLPTNQCSDLGKYPVYSSQTADNGLMGYYDEYLFENCITWTTDGANAGDVNFRKGKFYCTNVCGVLISDQGYANLCVAHIIGKVAKNYVSYIGNPKLMNNTMGIITINLPPLNEQENISNIIEDLNYEIQLQNEEKNCLIAQRKALQQYLLNGIVRV